MSETRLKHHAEKPHGSEMSPGEEGQPHGAAPVKGPPCSPGPLLPCSPVSAAVPPHVSRSSWLLAAASMARFFRGHPRPRRCASLRPQSRLLIAYDLAACLAAFFTISPATFLCSFHIHVGESNISLLSIIPYRNHPPPGPNPGLVISVITPIPKRIWNTSFPGQ